MKKLGKHTIAGWTWRILLGMCLTPVVLFAICALLLCIPAVQKWAVDSAADYLSEEMGMKVTVGSVRLKTPISISLGDVLAMSDTIPSDTILHTSQLEVVAKVRPLLDGQLEADCFRLTGITLNTMDLIDAISIKGKAGELYLDSHYTDLKAEIANITNLSLSDAHLLLTVPDSVPEDTTPKTPVAWQVKLHDVKLHNVAIDVSVHPTIDSIFVSTHFGEASLAGTLDLKDEIYSFSGIKANGSRLAYNDMIGLSGMSLSLDSFEYKGATGNMFVSIDSLSGQEKNGFNVRNVRAKVLMDSTSITIPQGYLLTDDSQATLAYRMDLTAFDETNPGTMSLNMQSQLGKSDILNAVSLYDKQLAKTVNAYLSAKPAIINASIEGNMQDLRIPDFFASIDGIGTAKGSMSMKGDLIACDIDARTNGGHAADIPLPLCTASVKGTYDMKSEKYNAHVLADIDRYMYDKFNLSNTNLDVRLLNYNIDGTCIIDNPQMSVALDLDATHKGGWLSGVMDLDMAHADILSMGLTEDTLLISTGGNMAFETNLNNLFSINGHVNETSLFLSNDTIHTDQFDIEANTTLTSTYADIETGDLHFSLNMPSNLFKASDKLAKLTSEATKQIKNRTTNLELLKSYLPDADLHATAGPRNPVSTILSTMGVQFDQFSVDLNLSPSDGIKGNGRIYALRVDTIRIDTTYFNIRQDSTLLTFDTGIKCSKQLGVVDAFTAQVDGYLSTQQLRAHLLFFDAKGKKGIDIGLQGETTDSSLRVSIFPDKPIIAYKKFKLTGDNYLEHRFSKPYLGDIQLVSEEDDCTLSIAALESDEGRQKALFDLENLNLKEMLRVLPFLPNMNGSLSVDCAYQERDDSYWVDGILNLDNFYYEGMKVGNVGSMFTYEPEGLTKHKLEADLSFEGTDVLSIDGMYDTNGDGMLNAGLTLIDIPMQMFSAFVPDQFVQLTGNMAGEMTIAGPTDRLTFNGFLQPKNIHMLASQYSVDLRLADDTVSVNSSKILFDKLPIYSPSGDQLALNGSVDFSNFDEMPIQLSLQGRNFKLVDSKRNAKSVLFGQVYGDIFTRVTGTSNDISVRGYINVLNKTNMTYIMAETPLSQGDRFDDIVTFIDFELPPDSSSVEEAKKTLTGVDMQLKLNVEDGARLRCEFSADRQSYVNVRFGGSLDMTYTPEGRMTMQGRLTANEGEMKYTLPVIPLKTFVLQSGSYVEFNGDMYNPTLNITATERTKAPVGTESGSTQSVQFDVGLKISQTLNDMGLLFTIDAPENPNVQSELDSYTDEEKSKLAVALLATGMYVADNNTSSITADNALSAFLQSEINNITGRALNSIVDVSLGMDRTTYANGQDGIDYSFKFSKRFFSDRLSVTIGGRVSDNKAVNEQTDIGSFIDDVSLEWRIDPGGTRSVRLFHNKDFNNIFEGVLEKNGAGVVLRKKMDSLSELIFWKKKKE